MQDGADVKFEHPAPLKQFGVLHIQSWQTTSRRLLCVQDGAEAEHGHQGIEGPSVCVATPAPRGPHVVLLSGGSSTASHCLASGRPHPEENVNQPLAMRLVTSHVTSRLLC